MKFFDIHTHKLPPASGNIVNVLRDFDKIPVTGFYSAGMHPWYLDSHAEEQFEKLRIACEQENVLAVGECGLDKICDVDIDLQKKWFAAQIELAGKIRKPLIIHCVKAYDEVLQMLKNKRVIVPVLFHGYNKNAVIAGRIVREGYYLSFGKNLLDMHVACVLSDIPADRFFLETDEASVNISRIYSAAAAIRKISPEELQKQLFDNAQKVFGDKFVAYDE